MDKKEEKTFTKGKRYCLRLLAVRSRSEFEVKERLKKAGYNTLVVESILESLRKEKLVDDLSFSKEWISRRGKSRGVAMLVDELKQKGIDEKVIDEAIKNSSELNDEETAKRIMEDKLSKEESEDIEKVKAKMLRLLISKGVDRETAEDVINGKIE